MSCIKSISLSDPLIDNVSRDNMIASECKILELDLTKCKISELDFVSKYKIHINRNDTFHGLVSWFDCYFEATKDKIELSTSPYKKQTHWKQTVFYLQKPVKVFRGDIVWG